MEKTPTPKGPTLRQFQARFPTEDSCLEHLKLVRYGAKHTCAKCEREARYYRVKARRSYECEHCGYQVYPTAGTPFHGTRTSLRDWFYVMFLFTSTRNGVAAKRVQREIGVTYKTAWRMCNLIRKYMGYVDGDDALGGADGQPVEVDHAFIGGETTKANAFRNKAIVMGMVERGGDIITRHIPARNSGQVSRVVRAAIKPGSRVSSDADVSFGGLSTMGYSHTEVKQRRGSYSAETNTIEGYWALLKRGINGTYISVSQKHLQSYLSEFEFRYNLRKHPHMMFDLLLLSFPRGA
ncbi:IS1595 family transposase [Brevundimonas basaltis]|uniref:Ribosomal protein L37AE/L43A n=1 Tax=Brevundimonas basaltis TaxID=472166 RepID=A0A7W8HXK0_9CAUL|nr:IS1595 family transposase [Brevundimonas basaltis]MBB5291727.1 ribosomal protein L37AE/L43A [Brevundimonas basaltis]